MIRFIKIRLKAQAMQFALLVAAMVALLLSAFIALTHIHSFFGIQSQELLNLVENTNTKILETIESGDVQNDTISSTQGKITTKTVIKYHGAWKKIYVHNQLRKKGFAKTALFGSKQEPKTPNLYLINSSAPLLVVGTTRIEGNSYLPKAGVRAGTIAGNYYQGESLVYGSTKISAKTLPKLESSWRVYLHYLAGNSILQSDSIEGYSENQKRSFLKREKLVYSPNTISINGGLQGNFIVKSATKIAVSADAVLDDVVLVAPEISFERGFTGTVQALATKKIEVAKNVTLEYPSSLIVIKEVKKEEKIDHTKSNTALLIADDAVINGSVVFLKNKLDEQRYTGVRSDIMVTKNAQIVGEVYCEGNIELLGTVKGSLYTEQFVANQYGSIYINHIYHGKVLRNPIDNYSGLPFDNNLKNISKWMY